MNFPTPPAGMFDAFKNLPPPRMVYGILGVKKEVQFELNLKDKTFMIVVPADSYEDAIHRSTKAMRIGKLNPEEWDIPALSVYAPYTEMISEDEVNRVKEVMYYVRSTERPPEPTLAEKKEKSAKEMVSYVRYVFANASVEDRLAAENVIIQFLQSHESRAKKVPQGN